MTKVDITALRLVGKHGLRDAAIQAQQCYYLAPPHSKEYWGLVLEYIKSI